MKKGIFLAANPETVRRVYAEKQMARLRELVDLDETVYPSVKAAREAGVKDTDYIFSTWSMIPVSEAQIREYYPSLQALFYAAGSVQSFARPFLNSRVRIFSGWRANGTTVAQFSFAQILLAAKGFLRVSQAMEEQGWEASRRLFDTYPGAYDIKVGLLGCGAIGSQVAEMLRNTDMETWVFDPFLPKERAEELGVRLTGMEDIFRNCLIVSNHLANLPETQGIIKREHFMSMPPYSTFINTGRGAQLNEQDLYDALAEDPTRTALLDVLIDELHSDDSPLKTLPNCFITPHMAGAAGQEVRRMADKVIEAVVACEAGEKSSMEVTLKMLETMA